jgi:hypothetical protein
MMIIKIKPITDLISMVYWRLLAFTGRFLKAFPDQFSRVSQHLSVFCPCKPAEKAVYWIVPYYVRECEPVKRFSHPPVAT